MKLGEMESLRMEIAGTRLPTTRRSAVWIWWIRRASFWRTLSWRTSIWPTSIWRKLIWRTLVRRAGGKRKALAVQETAALGDRRFVCVIQFERQRFLIGSSPSSVTLLAQLPDEFSDDAGS